MFSSVQQSSRLTSMNPMGYPAHPNQFSARAFKAPPMGPYYTTPKHDLGYLSGGATEYYNTPRYATTTTDSHRSTKYPPLRTDSGPRVYNSRATTQQPNYSTYRENTRSAYVYEQSDFDSEYGDTATNASYSPTDDSVFSPAMSTDSLVTFKSPLPSPLRENNNTSSMRRNSISMSSSAPPLQPGSTTERSFPSSNRHEGGILRSDHLRSTHSPIPPIPIPPSNSSHTRSTSAYNPIPPPPTSTYNTWHHTIPTIPPSESGTEDVSLEARMNAEHNAISSSSSYYASDSGSSAGHSTPVPVNHERNLPLHQHQQRVPFPRSDGMRTYDDGVDVDAIVQPSSYTNSSVHDLTLSLDSSAIVESLEEGRGTGYIRRSGSRERERERESLGNGSGNGNDGWMKTMTRERRDSGSGSSSNSGHGYRRPPSRGVPSEREYEYTGNAGHSVNSSSSNHATYHSSTPRTSPKSGETEQTQLRSSPPPPPSQKNVPPPPSRQRRNSGVTSTEIDLSKSQLQSPSNGPPPPPASTSTSRQRRNSGVTVTEIDKTKSQSQPVSGPSTSSTPAPPPASASTSNTRQRRNSGSTSTAVEQEKAQVPAPVPPTSTSNSTLNSRKRRNSRVASLPQSQSQMVNEVPIPIPVPVPVSPDMNVNMINSPRSSPLRREDVHLDQVTGVGIGGPGVRGLSESVLGLHLPEAPLPQTHVTNVSRDSSPRWNDRYNSTSINTRSSPPLPVTSGVTSSVYDRDRGHGHGILRPSSTTPAISTGNGTGNGYHTYDSSPPPNANVNMNMNSYHSGLGYRSLAHVQDDPYRPLTGPPLPPNSSYRDNNSNSYPSRSQGHGHGTVVVPGQSGPLSSSSSSYGSSALYHYSTTPVPPVPVPVMTAPTGMGMTMTRNRNNSVSNNWGAVRKDGLGLGIGNGSGSGMVSKTSTPSPPSRFTQTHRPGSVVYDERDRERERERERERYSAQGQGQGSTSASLVASGQPIYANVLTSSPKGIHTNSNSNSNSPTQIYNRTSPPQQYQHQQNENSSGKPVLTSLGQSQSQPPRSYTPFPAPSRRHTTTTTTTTTPTTTPTTSNAQSQLNQTQQHGYVHVHGEPPKRRYSDGDQNDGPSFSINTGSGNGIGMGKGGSLGRCVRWNDNLVCPSPVPLNRRKGWFSRRGDQLWTNEGAYKPALPGDEYPPDLDDYPEFGTGWMNEEGVRIDMEHRLVPKVPLRSALKQPKPIC